MGFFLRLFILFFVSFGPYLLSEEKINDQFKVVSVSNVNVKNLTLKQLTQEIKNNQVIYSLSYILFLVLHVHVMILHRTFQINI